MEQITHVTDGGTMRYREAPVGIEPTNRRFAVRQARATDSASERNAQQRTPAHTAKSAPAAPVAAPALVAFWRPQRDGETSV